MTRIFLGFLLFILNLNAQATVRLRSEQKNVPGEIIFKLNHNKLKTQKDKIHMIDSLLSPFQTKEVTPLNKANDLIFVSLHNISATTDVLERLQNNPYVEFAETNFIYEIATTPNDPDFALNWSMPNINVQPLWSAGRTGSKQVVVAIIDSGVDITHPDLKANIFVNSAEIPGNRKDDDRNGYVDDVNGWNFINKNNNPNDDLGHGTHCAGIVGAVGNNGVGVTGVNWQVSIMPLKFIDGEGRGNAKAAIESIEYAVKMKAHIINASWGNGQQSRALETAVKAAESAGILFVAAAGNEFMNNDFTPSYPANLPNSNIISVSVTNNKDQLTIYSNVGEKTVHIGAPGENIWSTSKNGTYESMSGTSMSAPHVAGAAALLKSINTNWSYLEIKNRLLQSARPILAMRRTSISKGVLDVNAALNGQTITWQDPNPTAWKSVSNVQESTHPAPNSTDQLAVIKQPGAKFIRLVFEKIDLEPGNDTLVILSSKNGPVEIISGSKQNYTTQYMPGELIVLNMLTNEAKQSWGWKLNRVEYIE